MYRQTYPRPYYEEEPEHTVRQLRDLEHQNRVANLEVHRLTADNEIMQAHLAVRQMKDEMEASNSTRVPYVPVEYEGREILIARSTLIESSLLELYMRFTKEFGMTATEDMPFVKCFSHASKSHIFYAPMSLSVIMWKKSDRDDKKDEYREVAQWEKSWREVAFFVEKMKITRRTSQDIDEDISLEEPASLGILATIRGYIPKLW